MRIIIYLIIFIAAFGLMFIFDSAGVNLIVSLIAVFVIVMTGYIGWLVWMNSRLLNILDYQCNPGKFIEECEKFKKLSKRPQYQMKCNVNIATGLITLGRDKEALEILLRESNSGVKCSALTTFACCVNLFICYLNLGELDTAGEVYERLIKAARAKILINQPLLCSMDVSVARYLYLKHKSADTAKVFLENLDYIGGIYKNHNSKRAKLEIIYLKAEALRELGDTESVAKKYKTVAENGGSLWIAEAARRRG